MGESENRKLVKLMLTVLLLAIFSESNAQGYLEGANVSYDEMPLKVSSSTVDRSFNCGNFKVTDIVPVYLKKDRSQFLMFGLNFESFAFTGIHPDFPVTGFYSIAPVAGYSNQINMRFNLSALLIPILNSDLYIVSGSDFHFGGVVRGAYRVNDNFLIRAILGYRQQFYGPQYIVFLGLDWKIGNKWRISGDLPNNATLCYSIHPKLNTGISYLSGNTSFHLSRQNHYLQYNYAQPGLFLEYYLTSKLAIRGTAAYSFIRNLDIYTMDEKVTGVVDYIPIGPKPLALNPEVSNGPAFKLALSLRLPEHKNK